MRPKLLKYVKEGDTLTVFRWNQLIDAVNRAGLNLGQNCGLAAQFTPQGVALRVTARGGGGMARGLVTTAIPTGTIGTPSTTGKVTLYTWDGTTSAAGETGVAVLNDMTIAASVPNGTVVKVALIDGDYWLVSSECY